MTLLAPDATTAYWSLGDLWIVHLSGKETEGRFSLLETLWPPGFPAPLHVHRDADELFYVLEGDVTVHLPGRTFHRGTGSCILCPRGVPHTYEAASSTPPRLLYIGSPAGFEDFVVAAGEPAGELTLPTGEPDVARAIALAPEFAIDVLGAPGDAPEGASDVQPEAKAYWSLGHLAVVHVPGASTERRFSFVEHLSPPGERPPMHIHRLEAQLWYVLEGELMVDIGGATRRCSPGQWAYGPAGVPHRHEVTSGTPARILEVNSPAGFEDFVAAAGEPAAELTLPPGAPDLSREIALAPQYGIELVGLPAL